MEQTGLGIRLGAPSLTAMTAGMAVGHFWHLPGLRLALPLALFLLLYPALLRVDWGAVRASGTPLLLLVALVFNLALAPALMWPLTRFAPGLTPASVAGLTLFSLAPCAGFVPGFAAMIGGNVTLAVAIQGTSSLLCILTAPLWSGLLLPSEVHLPAAVMLGHLCLSLLLPLSAATATRLLILRRRGEAAFLAFEDRMRPLSMAGIVGIFFIIFHENGGLLLSDPWLPLRVTPVVAVFLGCLFGLSWLAARTLHTHGPETKSFLLGTTIRNNAIAVALAVTAFDGPVQVVTAITGPLSQFPLILVGISFLERIRD